MADKKLGTITHYYSNLGVGIIKLEDTLSVGDTIKIQGSTTDLEQTVDQMQVNKADVENAEKGQEIGIKLNDKVRVGDSVFLA